MKQNSESSHKAQMRSTNADISEGEEEQEKEAEEEAHEDRDYSEDKEPKP